MSDFPRQWGLFLFFSSKKKNNNQFTCRMTRYIYTIILYDSIIKGEAKIKLSRCRRNNIEGKKPEEGNFTAKQSAKDT